MQAAVQDILNHKAFNWDTYLRRLNPGAKPKKKPSIIKDIPATKDYSIITEYIAILKLLERATQLL